MKALNRVVVFFLILPVSAAGFSVAGSEPFARPRGIILFIGDGMGINQLRAATIYSRQVLNTPLAIDSMPVRGITATGSADSEITDSAAAATALYSGYKTDNGVLNYLPDGRKVFTVADAARKAGMAVGVVSTARLTHATPAGIYSRARHRDEENSIADQLPEFEPAVALGGGRAFFIPKSVEGSRRLDDNNLVETMIGKGYAYVTDDAELTAVNPSVTPRLLGLFAMSHMAYELDRLNSPRLSDQPSLAAMTKVALSVLERNKSGFFIMIEAGRIDHACHAHDIKASIYDTLALDAAVRTALDYRKANPEVLVVVTGDHETGGLGLGTGTEYSLDLTALAPFRNSVEYLSKKILKNPGDMELTLKKAGFDLTEEERALLSAFPPWTSTDAVAEPGVSREKLRKYLVSWLHYALGSIESRRARIGWTAFVHTAQPVITYAEGPGEKDFSGAYDNTDIAGKIARLLGITPDPPEKEPNE